MRIDTAHACEFGIFCSDRQQRHFQCLTGFSGLEENHRNQLKGISVRLDNLSIKKKRKEKKNYMTDAH